jgi:transcriptional regulator with XRE-family HTH domain
MNDGVEVEECRLRRWRTERGLSLKDVEGLTGVGYARISRFELGKMEFRPETKIRMARALGVPIKDLFEPPHKRRRAS